MVVAIPAAVLVVIALAVLLLAWASSVFLAKPLTWLLLQLPVVGQSAAKAVGGMLDSIATWVLSWGQGAVQAMVDALDFVIGSAQWLVRQLAITLSSIVNTLTKLGAWTYAHVGALAGQVATLLARVNAIAAQLATALARITALGVTVGGIIATRLPAAIASAVAQAAKYADAAVRQLDRTLRAAIAAALATAFAAITAEERARQAADAAVRAAAAAEAANAARSAAAALAQAERTIGIEVDGLGRAIDGVATKIGPLAWPTVAIGLTTILTELETMRRACVDPTCSFMGPQLRSLELAQDVAMLAAISALVAQAARDPEAAAAETLAAVRPIDGLVRSTFGAISGIGF